MRTKTVYEAMAGILRTISGDVQSSSTKALLANLRQSINSESNLAAGVFPFVFANIPDEFLGETGEFTVAERSILSALQLYALHQQAKEQCVDAERASEGAGAWDNVGVSLRALRVGDSQSVDRRFNAMLTAANFSELVTHLRHLIKLLRSRTKAKVDYAQLAEDLYWFQMGQQGSIRLKWSRAYYRPLKEQEGEESDEKQ